MNKKVTKNQLREVLSEEIRQIVREEIQRELSTYPLKTKENKFSLFDSPTALDIDTFSLAKADKKQHQDPDENMINELINTAEVPSEYYQNMATPNTTNASANENPILTNKAYQATSLQEAQVVDGDDLNSLENTDFSSFV